MAKSEIEKNEENTRHISGASGGHYGKYTPEYEQGARLSGRDPQTGKPIQIAPEIKVSGSSGALGAIIGFCIVIFAPYLYFNGGIFGNRISNGSKVYTHYSSAEELGVFRIQDFKKLQKLGKVKPTRILKAGKCLVQFRRINSQWSKVGVNSWEDEKQAQIVANRNVVKIPSGARCRKGYLRPDG